MGIMGHGQLSGVKGCCLCKLCFLLNYSENIYENICRVNVVKCNRPSLNLSMYKLMYTDCTYNKSFLYELPSIM